MGEAAVAEVLVPLLFWVKEDVPLMMLADPCVNTLAPPTLIAVPPERFPVKLSVPALTVVAPA